NAFTRLRGGVVDFGAAGIADTDAGNVNGILGGGYATLAGADWAVNSTGAGDGPITAYTAYTDIPAGGGTIVDGPTSNVRLTGSTGSGGVHLAAAMTTIQTLLQNSADGIFLLVIDPAGQTLRLGTNGAVLVPSGKHDLIIGDDSGAFPKPGTLTAGGSDNTAGEIIFTSFGPYIQVGSVIADNGTGPVSVTVAGSGQVNFLGGNRTAPNNTYTGTNTIAGGTLSVSSDACLGASPGVATPGQIVINGGTLNAGNSFTLDSNRGIFLGSAGANGYNGGTISADSGVTLTYNGIIAGGTANASGGFTMTVGPGSLTKTGEGTLILGGANTYAGGTIVNAGILRVSSDANLGGVAGCYVPDNLVLNGGTLEASGTFTLNANRGVRLGPIGGSGSGTVMVDAAQLLTFNGQISDNWGGTGSLTKNGDGTLVLGGAVNDYSGNTMVSAGILQVNNSRSIPNGAGKGNLTVNGTLNLNGVNVALNGLSGSGTVDNITGTAMTLGVGNNDQTSSFG
ncbi:MAG: autotransporter-associated beta strand repeat-containing protein, partial [Planctomycetota bacterium]|nr:autotransporter-associated beta strand repeat-containing protein [Planctomycetota bacterium]